MKNVFSYKIKKSKRAKRLRLAVYCDGSVVVTLPIGVEESIINKFVQDKKRWILSKLQVYGAIDNKAIKRFSEKDYLQNKDKALKIVQDKVGFYNKVYKFKYKKILIKNQKTRWGSCSKTKNLNINYKIIFLPEVLRDYIIIHELCHLKEFNHSRKFWALVRKTLPNFEEAKKELRNLELYYK